MRALVLTVCLIGFASASAAQPLTLLTEENPPWNHRDAASGEIVGVATEVVRLAVARAGVEARLEILPWRRAYARALAEPGACVFATNRTEEREPLFQWVGPLARGGWAVLTQQDDPRRFAAITEVRDLRAAAAPGSAIESFLLEQAFSAIEIAPEEQNAQKLAAGRVDVWVSGEANAAAQSRALGLPRPRTALRFKSSILSLACSNATDPAVIAALNLGLSAARAEGALAPIAARYGLDPALLE